MFFCLHQGQEMDREDLWQHHHQNERKKFYTAVTCTVTHQKFVGEVALHDEKNKMERETSNTHTNIIRNKNKTDKPTVTVYRTQGKSILLLSSVCTCHFHLLYQSSSQDWLVLLPCLDKQKKDQVLITFKLCYYVDLRTNCGVAMKAGR